MIEADYFHKAESALKQADCIANGSGDQRHRHEWTSYHVAVAQVYATLAIAAASRTATGEGE